MMKEVAYLNTNLHTCRINNIVTHYGAESIYGAEIPLAVAGIVMKINVAYFALIVGVSQAMQPIVSFNYGAKKIKRVLKAYKLTLIISTTMTIIAFIIFQLFPRELVGIFGSGNELYYE